MFFSGKLLGESYFIKFNTNLKGLHETILFIKLHRQRILHQ